MNIGAEHVNKSEWRTYSPSPFHQICTILRTRAASRHAVLVFENFEQICQKPDLVSEIASILVLCDDDAIASKNIRVLIVGASDEMRKLISAYPNATTIANRLLELPEVSRLSITDSKALLRRGLVEKLGLAFDGSEDELLSRIAFTADGTAQHIHEIGLHVANQAIETASKISSGIVRQAERDWINESLTTDVNIIESQMNSKSTKIGRKNQVLYALGQTESDTFSANDVEDLIRQIFNGSNEDQKINAGAIMAEFSKAVNPLIKKSASGEAYRFVSPKYRTCLRIMLDLDEAGRVQKSHSGGLF